MSIPYLSYIFITATRLFYHKVNIFQLTLCNIFIYTLDSSCNRLQMALKKTKLIEWHNKPLFLCMNTRFLDVVLKVVKENNYPTPEYPLADLYWLAKEKALQYDYRYSKSIDVFIF